MEKKKILVIDDEPIIREVMIFRLESMGYDVFFAEDGQEGLDAVKAKKPDLVLLDLKMPTLNGDEVAKHIKSNDEIKNIPVILITASVDSVTEIVSECGADDYLIKPFDSDVFEEKVRNFLA